jgi:MFS transporter, DHA1 family, multidrug resistance protein
MPAAMTPDTQTKSPPPGDTRTPPAPTPPGALRRRAIVLGLIIAVGAFAIDMYIPGFPAIARDLRTDAGTVQLSMTSFFVALALGQIVYGPVSDAMGRRGPIFAGLALFVLGSVLAALAPRIGLLIGARFVQGLGAAATAVVPLAIVRDQHTGPEAARLLALAMAALSVSPILAPVFGGFLVQYTSWRLIFVVLIAIAFGASLLVAFALPETWPRHRRVRLRPLGILLTYARLLQNPRFIIPIGAAATGQAVLFVFLAGASFVFVTLHGLTPTQFGVLFALHAICIIGMSQFNAPMMRRFGAIRMVLGGAILLALAALVFTVLAWSGTGPLWPLVAATLTMFACLGIVLGPAFLTAMEPFGATAGAAAALGAGIEFATSSTVTLVMSLAADGTARPMAIALIVAALGALGFAIALANRRRRGPTAKEA